MKRTFERATNRSMGEKACVAAFLLAAVVGLPACRRKPARMTNDPVLNAYATEPDWNDPDRLIPLSYQQAQGQRIFYEKCVWCHADSTPAGPSNRDNVTPTPPLMNDGAKLNALSDEFMQNYITLGGAAMGKSAMEPAWGRTLTPEEIKAVIAFTRAIAQPPYQPPARPGPRYAERRRKRP